MSANAIETLRQVVEEHGFVLPGDSALYIALWGLESSVAEEARGVPS